MFVKHTHQKSGKLSAPRVVLSVDPSACSITVPGSGNAPITIAFEDVRIAINDDQLAHSVVESIEGEINKIVIEKDDCQNQPGNQMQFDPDQIPDPDQIQPDLSNLFDPDLSPISPNTGSNQSDADNDNHAHTHSD